MPIFALTGVEGKMFHPMAFTVVMALIARAGPVADVRAGRRGALFVTGKVDGEGERGVHALGQALLRSRCWIGRWGARQRVVGGAVALIVLAGLGSPVAWARSSSRNLDEGDYRPCTPCAFLVPA